MRMLNQYKNNVSLLNSACISLLSVRGSYFRLLSTIGLLSGFIIAPIDYPISGTYIDFSYRSWLRRWFIRFILIIFRTLYPFSTGLESWPRRMARGCVLTMAKNCPKIWSVHLHIDLAFRDFSLVLVVVYFFLSVQGLYSCTSYDIS